MREGSRERGGNAMGKVGVEGRAGRPMEGRREGGREGRKEREWVEGGGIEKENDGGSGRKEGREWGI